MLFNAIFNNISVVEETGLPGENQQPAANP
jgi:hypothetical protein